MFKSMMNAVSKIIFNFCNLYSAHQPIDGLLYALYNVTMTVIFVSFYIIFEQDLPTFPNNLPAFYYHNRTFLKKFFTHYAYFVPYVTFSGALVFVIYWQGLSGTLKEGQLMDLYTYGLFSSVVNTIVHHVMVIIFVKNWNWIMVFLLILSLVQLPLACWGNDIMPSS